MRRKWLLIICTAFLPAIISAPPNKAMAVVNNVEEKKIEKEIFLENRKTTSNKIGWTQETDGRFFYYNKRGIKEKGWLTVDSKVYYLDKVTGERLTGIQVIGRKRYFFDLTTGERKHGWVDFQGQRYYFCKKGHAITGLRKFGGYRYYFDYKGRLSRDTVVRGKYLADRDGKLVRGWYELNNQKYYADPKDYRIKKDGWYTINRKMYYFQSDGTMKQLSGIVTASNKKRYYFDPNTGEMTTGWVTRKNYTYYFSPKTGRAYRGWHTIGDKRYYFNSRGVLVKKRFIKNLYYVNENGEKVYGWLNLNNQRYYLDLPNGVLAKGWKDIGKYRYYFDKEGVMQREKWVDGRYLRSNGRMARRTWVGAYYVNGDGLKTGRVRNTGLYTSRGKTYYLNEQFKKLFGWQTIGEKTYHFDSQTGVMDKKKWVDGFYLDENGIRKTSALMTIDGITYLFLENGTKAMGLTEYEGKKYYFNTTDGARYTGFKVVDSITYYFNPAEEGAMAINKEILIDGHYYFFDENGHMSTETDSNSDLGRQIAIYAQRFIGYPYVSKGDQDLTKGVDCSGFTMLVFRHFGIDIPRTTWTQHDGMDGYRKPVRVSVENLKPGDLIFYYAKNTHVGIYIGDGKMVHSSNPAKPPQGGIKISPYDYTYIYGCVRYW